MIVGRVYQIQLTPASFCCSSTVSMATSRSILISSNTNSSSILTMWAWNIIFLTLIIVCIFTRCHKILTRCFDCQQADKGITTCGHVVSMLHTPMIRWSWKDKFQPQISEVFVTFTDDWRHCNTMTDAYTHTPLPHTFLTGTSDWPSVCYPCSSRPI